MKNDENDLDYIVVSLCRGLADYDANEIVPDSADRESCDRKDGYTDSRES